MQTEARQRFIFGHKFFKAKELHNVSGRNAFTYFYFQKQLLALKWKQFSNLKQVITHPIKQVINRLQFKERTTPKKKKSPHHKTSKMSNSDAESEAHCWNQHNTSGNGLTNTQCK